MNLMHRIAAVDHDFLREIARGTLSLETVFLIYGAIVLGAGLLWAVGVAVFGRGRAGASRSREQATPVAP
jgi:hypothetical protein